MAANYTPATPVEFMWFSAEEGGLLGSQAIAKDYEERGVKVCAPVRERLVADVQVKAMSQYDMTAWVKKGVPECIGIIQDFVDPTLTAYLAELVGKYRTFGPFTE